MGSSRYDVAVVGGGPAGLATALTLVRDGLDVIVIERSDYRSLRVGQHVAPGTKPLLGALGLSSLFESGRHVSCPGIRSVWGTSKPADRDYLFHPNGEGMNLSRPDFDSNLAAIAARLGARIVTSARISAITRSRGSWDISFQHEAQTSGIRCAAVIDATGRAASVAKRVGATPIVYDELVGVVGRTAGSSPDNHLVMIEAVENGWWYSAGLADGTIIATFMTDADLIDTSTRGRSAVWLRQLQASDITAARMTDAAVGAYLDV